MGERVEQEGVVHSTFEPIILKRSTGRKVRVALFVGVGLVWDGVRLVFDYNSGGP